MDDYLQRLENLTLPTRVRDLQMQNRRVCIYACTYLRTTSHAGKNNFYPEPTKFPFNSHSLNCQQKSLFSAVERINVSPLHRYSFFVRFRCAFAIDTSTIKHTPFIPHYLKRRNRCNSPSPRISLTFTGHHFHITSCFFLSIGMKRIRTFRGTEEILFEILHVFVTRLSFSRFKIWRSDVEQ